MHRAQQNKDPIATNDSQRALESQFVRDLCRSFVPEHRIIVESREAVRSGEKEMIEKIMWILVIVFPLSEIVLAIAKRANRDAARVEDRGSMRLLWLTIIAAVVLAIMFRSSRTGRLSFSPFLGQVLTITCLVCGFAIRWTSIFTLGRLFTVDVAVQQGHTVIQAGLYGYIRHPSYAGLLLTFVGLGLFLGNWISLAVLIVPITLAVTNRIAKEESVLRAVLGSPYIDYCARTKRIIPRIL